MIAEMTSWSKLYLSIFFCIVPKILYVRRRPKMHKTRREEATPHLQATGWFRGTKAELTPEINNLTLNTSLTDFIRLASSLSNYLDTNNTQYSNYYGFPIVLSLSCFVLVVLFPSKKCTRHSKCNHFFHKWDLKI